MTNTMAAISRIVPWTLSKSRLPMSRTSIWPTPGRLKTSSMTTTPAIRLAICTPITETTGIAALRRPWTHQRLGAPESLGPGRADVVLVEHVERRGAHEAQQDRPLRRGQREHREDERLDRLAGVVPSGPGEALRRQPPHAGEQGDEGDADEELGDGDAELADGRESDTVGAAVAHGGVDAEGDRRRHRHDAGGDDQRGGDRQLLAELAGDRRLGQRRAPEVAGEHAAHPLEVLGDERPVETELLADRRQAAPASPRRRRSTPARSPGSSRSRTKMTTLATSRATISSPNRRTQNHSTAPVLARHRAVAPRRGERRQPVTWRSLASKRACTSNSGRPVTPLRVTTRSWNRLTQTAGASVAICSAAWRRSSLASSGSAAIFDVGEQLLHLGAVVQPVVLGVGVVVEVARLDVDHVA